MLSRKCYGQSVQIMNRLEHWNGTSSWFSKLLRVSLLGWLDSSGPYFTIQMKFITVFICDCRAGCMQPATFIKENSIVDFIQMYVNHIYNNSPHP